MQCLHTNLSATTVMPAWTSFCTLCCALSTLIQVPSITRGKGAIWGYLISHAVIKDSNQLECTFSLCQSLQLAAVAHCIASFFATLFISRMFLLPHFHQCFLNPCPLCKACYFFFNQVWHIPKYPLDDFFNTYNGEKLPW